MLTGKRLWIIAFLVVVVSKGIAWGGEPQDLKLIDLLEPDEVVTLTLKESVLRALEDNLDITVSRQNRDVRLTDIVFQQAKFDPTVELSSRYDRTVRPLNRPILGLGGGPAGDEPDTIDQNDQRLSLGLNQKLLTGGTYDLSFNSNRNSVAGETSFLFNPSYYANLLFDLTQPLLRDFGLDVNSAQIRIARNSATIEQYVFIDQVLRVIAQVEQAYWELVFAREKEKVAKATLKAAQELLASNLAKVKAGVMAEVEALQARSEVANRVELVLVARKDVRDQEDQLRRLFTTNEKELSRAVVVVPLDEPIREANFTTALEAINVSLQKRPEVLQAQKRIDISGVNTKVAKNQLLPSLAFEGKIGLRGLGQNPDDTLDRTFSTDFYEMGGGLVLSYPLGNRSAQSQYVRRKLEADRAAASLQRVRQQVIIEAKEAIRRIRTDFKRMTTTRVARQLAEKQLKAEEARLNLGLSTTRFVLEFQRDLAVVSRNELRALVDYNQSLSNLRQKTAMAQDHYNLVLQ